MLSKSKVSSKKRVSKIGIQRMLALKNNHINLNLYTFPNFLQENHDNNKVLKLKKPSMGSNKHREHFSWTSTIHWKLILKSLAVLRRLCISQSRANRRYICGWHSCSWNYRKHPRFQKQKHSLRSVRDEAVPGGAWFRVA